MVDSQIQEAISVETATEEISVETTEEEEEI